MSGEEGENVAECACHVLLCVLNATNVHFALFVLSHSFSEEKRAGIKKKCSRVREHFYCACGSHINAGQFQLLQRAC
jgi:hypothetical protein